MTLATHAVPVGPLAVFSDCHARTLQQCATLLRLAGYLVEVGCDRQARRLASHLLAYFDTVEARNHAQEEAWLYPALLESMAGSDAICLREISGGLTLQHRTLESLWAGLRKELEAVAGGRPALLDDAQVERFVDTQCNHIALEEDELLPMASRLLSDAAMAQMQQALAQEPNSYSRSRCA